MTKVLGVFVVLFVFASVAAFADDETPTNSTQHHKKRRVVVIEEDDAPVSSMAFPNTLGLAVGPGVANTQVSVPVGGANPASASSRTRPFFGAYYERALIPYLSLRGELDYNQRGYSVTTGQGQAATVTDNAMNYIEMPIEVKGMYRFGVVTPYAVTGPFLGLLVSSGQVVQAGGQLQENDISNAINTFNFGWNFGAGTTFHVASHLELDASFRYSLGLANILAQSDPGVSRKLSSLQVIAGIGFTL
jgi:opacity protein-like surface antigen